MIIKKGLTLFKNEKCLIIVTGKQSAKIYLIDNKHMNLCVDLRLPSPSSEFSDKEGHFKQRGQGGFIASGSVREPQKQYLIKNFSNQLGKEVSRLNIEEQPQSLYLFTPAYMKNEIKKSFSNVLKEKIVMEIEGNYLDNHEFDLLEKIKAYKLISIAI